MNTKQLILAALATINESDLTQADSEMGVDSALTIDQQNAINKQLQNEQTAGPGSINAGVAVWQAIADSINE